MSVSLSRWRRDTCVGELPVRVGKHRHTVRVVLDKVLGSHRGVVRRFVLTHVLTLDPTPWQVFGQGRSAPARRERDAAMVLQYSLLNLAASATQTYAE